MTADSRVFRFIHLRRYQNAPAASATTTTPTPTPTPAPTPALDDFGGLELEGVDEVLPPAVVVVSSVLEEIEAGLVLIMLLLVLLLVLVTPIVVRAEGWPAQFNYQYELSDPLVLNITGRIAHPGNGVHSRSWSKSSSGNRCRYMRRLLHCCTWPCLRLLQCRHTRDSRRKEDRKKR